MARPGSIGPSIVVSDAVKRGNRSASADSGVAPEVKQDVKKADKEEIFQYDPDAKVNIDAEDIPEGLAATFKLIGDSQDGFYTMLVRSSMEETFGHNNQVRKVPGSGTKIQFTKGLFSTRSLTLAHWMLNHKSIGLRFSINEDDPGGYWRYIGYVEEYSEVQKRIVTRRAVV